MKHNSILWSCIVPSLKEPSYLLGTMHVNNIFTSQVYHQVIPYLDECKHFYTEIDFNYVQDNNVLNNQYLVDPIYRLDNYLGFKKYSKLKAIISKSFAVNLDHLLHLKSIFIINYISEKLLNKLSNRSLDAMLFDTAVDKNLEIGGIELISEHLEIIDNFNEKDHINQLLKIGHNPSRFREGVIVLNKHYIKQDISRMYSLSKKSLSKLKHELLYERNKKMSQSIFEKAHLGKSFFAFGAGHLAGEYGVLRILKHKGVLLKPLQIV